MGACAVALAVLGVRSNLQLAHWHDDRAIWAHAVEVTPDGFIAPTNLAACLGREAKVMREAAEDAREEGRIDEAKGLFARCRAKYEQAVDLLERGIAINPEFITARQSAFMYNFRLGRDQRAVEHLEALLALNERLPAALRTDFTSYRETAGNLWMKLGKFDKAAAEYQRVLAVTPENDTAREALTEARSKGAAEARLNSGF
jgi:tetratricopeptide (TPR) repeat protein